jgi:hypothetical protein
MDNYRQLSEDNPKNDLGYALIKWVKKVHDKKGYKKNRSVNSHLTITHYRDLISYEVKSTESLSRKINMW